MQHERWNCPKCRNKDFDTDPSQATVGFLAKLFESRSKRFTTLSCRMCGYTEIYRAKSSALGRIFDLFDGG